MGDLPGVAAFLIGKLTDTHSVDTILGRLKQLIEHVHTPQRIYPTLANGVVLTAGVGSWVVGTKVEIIPASTISKDYDVHWVNIEGLSANDTYEIILYSGGAGSEVEVGRTRVTRTAIQQAQNQAVMMTRLIAADVRLSAAIATGNGSNTATITVSYHEY